MKQKQLNKKNLIEFANHLYSKKGNKVECVKLCTGVMAKANGEVTNCALGELYATFVGPMYRRATKVELATGVSKFGELELQRDIEGDVLYDNDGNALLTGWVHNAVDESDAISQLTEKVKLRKLSGHECPSCDFKEDPEVVIEELRDRLSNIPEVNDQTIGMTKKDLESRAKRVSEELIDIANEFLG